MKSGSTEKKENKTLVTNSNYYGKSYLESIELSRMEVCQPLKCIFTENSIAYAPCYTGR